MADEERQALARLFTEDAAFTAAIAGATSVEDAVRIAGDFGIDATPEDFRLPQDSLSDAELEGVSGGDGWWTQYCAPSQRAGYCE